MSIATAIIGNSGTGKTASLRDLDPEKVLFIQTIKKPLPFKGDWQLFNSETKKGTVYRTDNSDYICAGISKAESIGKEIVIIDDFQYLMSNEFMRRSQEKGYDKFNDIGRHGWDVMNAAVNAPDSLRVYILCHSACDDYGQNVRMKTVGKMLDEKIVLEGMLSIVLRTKVIDGKYLFTTQNDGNDTVKTPMGMFSSAAIENDLAQVDKTICEYYNI